MCPCHTHEVHDEAVTPLRGPLSVALDGWTILVQRGLPQILDWFMEHATRADRFDLEVPDGDFCFVAAARTGRLPALAVAQRYSPSEGGFDPGIALIPETQRLFIGAGTRLLAYDLDRAELLWEDEAGIGFWHWSVYPAAVLMSAEIEFAAWDRSGQKLWSRFVEPPWDFSVLGDQVRLDVMGKVTTFPIMGG
jgi:hypothetical protein